MNKTKVVKSAQPSRLSIIRSLGFDNSATCDYCRGEQVMSAHTPGPKVRDAALCSDCQAEMRNGKPGRIWLCPYSDNGQTMAYVTWDNGATTSGDPNNTHMKALLDRSRREGTFTGFEESK